MLDNRLISTVSEEGRYKGSKGTIDYPKMEGLACSCGVWTLALPQVGLEAVADLPTQVKFSSPRCSRAFGSEMSVATTGPRWPDEDGFPETYAAK